MSEELTVYYGDDSGVEYDCELFGEIVTFDETTGKTVITIGADTTGGKISSVALTISKERWLELVKDVQEALECLEESKC